MKDKETIQHGTVRQTLSLRLRAPEGNLQIPWNIKFLYTYSTFFTSHQDLTEHKGGTHKGGEGKDLQWNTVACKI